MPKQEKKDKKKDKKTRLKVKSWYANRYQIVTVQRNILLLFTTISVISVAVTVIFVKNIMGSKSLEPYVIEVEEKTGIATVVDQLTSQRFSGNEMIRRYFMNEYIHAASGYDRNTYKEDANKVRLFSSPGVFGQYRRRINPRVLGADSVIKVRIKSIKFLNNTLAQIRLSSNTKTPKSKIPTMKDLVVTMRFSFVPQIKLSMEERLINPLGFRVTEYSVAEEVFSY